MSTITSEDGRLVHRRVMGASTTMCGLALEGDTLTYVGHPAHRVSCESCELVVNERASNRIKSWRDRAMIDIFEIWDEVNALVETVRLPPQFIFRLTPKHDRDDVVLTITANFPDVNDVEKTATTFKTEYIGWQLKALAPELRIPFVKNWIKNTVQGLWQHELDEWFMMQGEHVNAPHEPGHPQMIRSLV